MQKSSRVILRIVGLAGLIIAAFALTATAEPHIAGVLPSSGPTGLLAKVIGEGYLAPNGPINRSVVMLGNTAVQTYYRSSTELGFVVPPSADCGFHNVRVRTVTSIGADAEFSNSRSYIVNCPTGSPSPPDPELDVVTPSQAQPGQNMVVSGEHYLPPSSTFTYTMVEFDGELVPDTAFVNPESLRFAVPGDAACGPHSVRVVKRYPSGGPVLTSRTVELIVTQPCQAAASDWQIEDLDPAEGPPGLIVHIDGNGFPTDAQVQFAGGTISRVEFGGTAQRLSSSQMRFRVPDDADCGPADVLVGSLGAPGQFSNAATFTVTGPPCGDNGDGPPLGAPIFDVKSLEVVGSPALGATVQIQGEVANTGDASGTADIELEVNGSSLGNVTRSLTPNQQVTITSQPFTFDSLGSYTFRLHTQNDEMTRTVEIASGPGDGSSAPASPLQDLDTNGNCLLDTTEFLNAIDAWIDEAIANHVFFDAIDAWVAESNVCTESAGTKREHSPVRATLTPSRQAVEFQSNINAVGPFSIQVFDLSGRPVFNGSTSAAVLSWDLRDARGQRIPNGVYLYRSSRHEPGSPTTSSAYRMFWVLR